MQIAAGIPGMEIRKYLKYFFDSSFNLIPIDVLDYKKHFLHSPVSEYWILDPRELWKVQKTWIKLVNCLHVIFLLRAGILEAPK